MRIYLDNAATGFPKPDTVYDAMDRYHRELGAPVGRGAYQAAFDVQSLVRRCRKRAAEFFHAESLDRIVFTFNGTDGLNLLIHGFLKPGDHVVTTVMEHNSVLRPLRFLESRGVERTIVQADSTGLVDPGDIKAAIQDNTRLVAMIHASNVTGTLQSVEDVAEITHAAGAYFLLDAAQSAGHIPIDVQSQGIDFLACPGHKGLMGPLGTGLVYIKPGLEDRIESTRQGGTGSQSEDDRQPENLPDKYESGNHNAPGLIGLEAGLAWLQSQSLTELRSHEIALMAQLRAGLEGVPSITLYGPADPEDQIGVLSLNVEGYEPQVLASILDETFGINIRAGFHCAPLVHRVLGTTELGGTARLSAGPFTTSDDIEAATEALGQIAGAV